MNENKEIKLYHLPDPDTSNQDVQGNISSSIRNMTEPMVVQQNYIKSANFKTGVQGWKIDASGNLEANDGNFRGDLTGATGTFSGTLTATSVNIPDATTANSFHVDSSGNTWWGTNVATGYATAPASVLNTGVGSFSNISITGGTLSINSGVASIDSAGAAVFKSISIGGATLQYQVTNAGIINFGDGSDGAFSTSGNLVLTRDMYYTTLSVSTGDTIDPAGYRIFCTTSLTLVGTGKIARNGNGGTNASGATQGVGGAALADGYLKGSAAGKDGATGSAVAGTQGSTTANSIGTAGSAGGAGGAGGGAGGAAGTWSTSNVKLIANWHLATLLDISASGSTVKFDNSSGGGSGGSGQNGVGNGSFTGAGGGSGSAGGIIALYAKDITISASASITANGGNGGNGDAGSNGGGNGGNGGGGGGAGGNGGQIILVYNTLTNSGSITATAGTGGSGGNASTGTPAGGAGVAGTAGTAGTLRQFQVSL